MKALGERCVCSGDRCVSAARSQIYFAGAGTEEGESSQLVCGIISNFVLPRLGEYNQSFKVISSVASLSLGKVYILCPRRKVSF